MGAQGHKGLATDRNLCEWRVNGHQVLLNIGDEIMEGEGAGVFVVT